MKNNISSYYENYYKNLGDRSYEMAKGGITSRVQTLLDWLDVHCPVGGSVLDIGCGDSFLSKQRPRLDWTGIDINTEKSQCNSVTHDLMVSPYPFPDAKFDAVVCSEVLEHVWDFRIVLKEAHRVLKQGGYFLISTPNHYWIDHIMQNFSQLDFDADKPHLFEHIRFYSYQTHEKYLKLAGFSVVDFTGADAQYSAFFARTRSYLTAYLSQYKLGLSSHNIDQIIGRCFPYNNHTIMVLSQK